MRNEPNWNPVRQGERYCSPGCGGCCTYESFVRATSAGEALAQRLGAGWKARVWENLGWHYEAIGADGRLRVSPGSNGNESGFYTAYLDPDGKPDGPSGGCAFGAPTGRTPEEAVSAVILRVLTKARSLVDLLLDLRGIGAADELLEPGAMKLLGSAK